MHATGGLASAGTRSGGRPVVSDEGDGIDPSTPRAGLQPVLARVAAAEAPAWASTSSGPRRGARRPGRGRDRPPVAARSSGSACRPAPGPATSPDRRPPSVGPLDLPLRPAAAARHGRTTRAGLTDLAEVEAMSGPNTQYDPVEVAALDPAALDAGRRRTRSRPSPPPSTLDELKAARLAHQGDKSPLALANREIGALPPSAKAEAGKRVGAGPRPRWRRRSPRDRPSSRPSATPGILVEETVDVTVPRAPAPRWAPATRSSLVTERVADIFVGDGLGDRRGPRGRVRVAQLRRPQPRPRTTRPARMQDTFFVDPPDAGPGAAHPHLAGAGAHHARARAADLRRSAPARSSAPTTSTPRTPRSSTRSRAWSSTRASPWPTSRARSTRSSQRLFGEGIVTRLRPSYFPFTEPSAEIDCRCFVCRGAATTAVLPHLRRHRLDRAGAAAAWSTAACCAPAAIDPDRYTRLRLRAGHRAGADAAARRQDMHDIVEGDVRFSAAVRDGDLMRAPVSWLRELRRPARRR